MLNLVNFTPFELQALLDAIHDMDFSEERFAEEDTGGPEA